MGDFLTRLIQPVLKINKGEWSKVFLMFCYFFLVIATYYIVKPVRSAIFLDRLGPDKLPYVYMGEAVLVGIISFFYARFVDHHRKENILIGTTVIFSACLLVFWFLFRFQVSWFAFLFYLWSAVFSTMSVTQFWLLSNDLFNPREAKRLFGFIGSGGVLGAICGGFLTARTVHSIGTENLLLISAGIIMMCVLFIKLACRYLPSETVKESLPSSVEAPQGAAAKKSVSKLITGSSYLILLLLIVAVGRILSTFVDFQFQSMVNDTFFSKDSKTAFFGGFFAALNGAAFIIQFLLTSRILKKFGVGTALLFLPIGLSLGMTGFLIAPILGFAALNKFFDGSLNYSIQSASREILYLPISRTVRHKVKPFIDMFVYRFSKGIGGFLILIFMTPLGLSLRGLSLMALLFIGVWFLVVVLMKKEYVKALKDLVSGSVKSRTDFIPSNDVLDPKFLEALGNEELKKIFQESESRPDRVYRRIVELAQLAVFENGEATNHEDHAAGFIRALLQQEYWKSLPKEEPEATKEADLDQMIMEILKREIPPGSGAGPEAERIQPGPVPEDWIHRLTDCIQKKAVPDEIRRKAIEALRILGGTEAQSIFREALQDPEETLRYDLIKALTKLRSDQKKPILDLIPLTQYLAQEATRYSQILFLISIHQKNINARQEKSSDWDERFLKVLESLREESFERIFNLLALHYPSEVITLIYDRYREGDNYVRAHAAELLDNIVGHEVERILLPVLEQDATHLLTSNGRWTPLSQEEVLKQITRGRDPWLIVMVAFLIVHLRMDRLASTLEALSDDKWPLVREAARLALIRLELMKKIPA